MIVPRKGERRCQSRLKEATYDIVVKNGLVIDPYQDIHEVMDLAISNGKIVDVRKGINESLAGKVIDASGLIVTPGIIDIHVHCCYNILNIGIDPESCCLEKGCTTVLDVGSTGELNFRGFRKYVIERSRTRILALLNIESLGMIEYGSQGQKWPKLIMEYEELFINVENTVKVIEDNRDVILGIKWAHHGLTGLRLAREAADRAKCILMAENHLEPETIKYLKKGDVVTHSFHGLKWMGNPYDGILNEDGNVKPEFYDAIKRGVIIDVGHGAASFSWKVAEKAFSQGVKPDTISTDLHVSSVKGPVYDMPTTMSKFLLLGMSLEEVIRASTSKPAEVIGMLGEIGTLKPDARADVTIFKLEEGKFQYTDCMKESRIGKQKLTPVKVIKDGRIII